MLLAHYLLAIYYSKESLIGKGTQKNYILLSFIVFISVASFYVIPNFIFFWFGIHYAIGEAYSHSYLGSEFPSDNYLAGICSLFHLFLYFNAFSFNLFQIQAIEKLNFSFLINYSFSISLLLFFILAALVLINNKISLKLKISLISVEALFILASSYLSKTQLPFIISIFYHIFFWFISSIYRSIKNKKDIRDFVVKTISINFAMILISLALTTQISDMFNIISKRSAIDQSLFLLGFFHIYSSFLNKKLNPQWIYKLGRLKNAF